MLYDLGELGETRDAITNLQIKLRHVPNTDRTQGAAAMRPWLRRTSSWRPTARRTQPGTSAGCDDAR